MSDQGQRTSHTSRRNKVSLSEPSSSGILLPFGDYRAENVLVQMVQGQYTPNEDLAEKLRKRLIEPGRLPPDYISPLSTGPDRDATVRDVLRGLLQEYSSEVGGPITEAVIDAYYGLTVGLGPLQLFISDPSITDLRIGDDGAVFVAVHGGSWQSTTMRLSPAETERVARQIAELRGAPLGEGQSRKAVDFPDGSRFILHAPPRSQNPYYRVVARRRGEKTLSLDDWIGLGSLSPEVAEFLVDAIVTHHCNAIVAGTTGAGKTALVTALLEELSPEEAPAIVQDVAEIVTQHPGAMRLNFDRSEYDLAIADCLRMRPSRVVVGECLGEETFLVLELMNTGGGGHMTTGHGESAQTVLSRLAGAALRHPSARGLLQVVDLYVRVGVDLVIFLDIRDGHRVVAAIEEVEWEPTAQYQPLLYPLRNAWRYIGEGRWEAGPAMQEHTPKVQRKLAATWTMPSAGLARYQIRGLIEDSVREANRLVSQGRYREAVRLLEQVLNEHPTEARSAEVPRLLHAARTRDQAEQAGRKETEEALWRTVVANLRAPDTAGFALQQLVGLRGADDVGHKLALLLKRAGAVALPTELLQALEEPLRQAALMFWEENDERA